MSDRPWITYIMLSREPVRLDREAFVRMFFPQYVKPYEPSYMSNDRNWNRMRSRTNEQRNAVARAQQTKRDAKIDAAYAEYVKCLPFRKRVKREAP